MTDTALPRPRRTALTSAQRAELVALAADCFRCGRSAAETSEGLVRFGVSPRVVRDLIREATTLWTVERRALCLRGEAAEPVPMSRVERVMVLTTPNRREAA